MTATNHALTGAVVALVIQEPILAIPLAFLSHFAVDYIPHFSFKDSDMFKRNFNTLLISDALMCIFLVGLTYLFIPEMWLVVSVCMFVATSPDLFWIYPRLYKEKIKGLPRNDGAFSAWHSGIQSRSHNRFARRGIRNELLWSALMITLIIVLK